jgi:hypothetical protein
MDLASGCEDVSRMEEAIWEMEGGLQCPKAVDADTVITSEKGSGKSRG